MIVFEKTNKFNEEMYKYIDFSEEEISEIKNHNKLGKMFDVMDVVLRMKLFKSSFACMVSNIVYQQVAFKVARYSEVMLFDYLDYDITPERILSVTDKEFKKFKIFGRRVDYIRNFAVFTLNNKDFFEKLNYLSEKEIYDELIKIPGIGSWSIEMFFLFGLGKKNILSLKDLIIVKGIKSLYTEEEYMKINDIRDSILHIGTITSLNLWKYNRRGIL